MLLAGGATALIAVMGSQRVHQIGYLYVLFPGIVSSSVLVTLGILLNNLSSISNRQYPMTWLPWPRSMFVSDASKKEQAIGGNNGLQGFDSSNSISGVELVSTKDDAEQPFDDVCI